MKARIIAGGQAAPPTTVRSRVENFAPFCFRYCSRPIQTVGTPAEKVTFSVSKSSCSDFPSSAQPGKTSFAPIIGALWHTPQALAWNIGTTGRTQSRAESAITSGNAVP